MHSDKWLDEFKQQLTSGIILLAIENGEKVQLAGSVSEDLVKKVTMQEIWLNKQQVFAVAAVEAVQTWLKQAEKILKKSMKHWNQQKTILKMFLLEYIYVYNEGK